MGLVRSVDSDLTAGARYNHGSGDDAIAVLFDVGERRLGVSLGLEYVIICSLLKLNKKEGLKCNFPCYLTNNGFLSLLFLGPSEFLKQILRRHLIKNCAVKNYIFHSLKYCMISNYLYFCACRNSIVNFFLNWLFTVAV